MHCQRTSEAAEAPNVWPKQEKKPCEKKRSSNSSSIDGFCIVFACGGCLEDCVRSLILVRSQKWISWCPAVLKLKSFTSCSLRCQISTVPGFMASPLIGTRRLWHIGAFRSHDGVQQNVNLLPAVAGKKMYSTIDYTVRCLLSTYPRVIFDV